MVNTAIELIVRIMCDPLPPDPVDGAYLFCTTADNQGSVFGAAGQVVNDRLAERILIYQAKPMAGYPGGDQYRRGLERIGIPSARISDVPAASRASINTLIESEALIRYARDRGMGSLIVVSPPFHQFRAFMTAVTVALRVCPELMIYSLSGSSLPWMETVVHSQGTLQAPRRQLIQEELQRIQTYQDKGDLARFETVLGYMDRRDA